MKMLKVTRRTTKAGNLVEGTCSDCGRRVFAATESELLFHGCLGKPQVIEAPGHYSAGDLDRPEPRL